MAVTIREERPCLCPILQGGMGVGDQSLDGLAGAVAACGGMGCISTAVCRLYREPDFARDPGQRQPPRPDR